MSFIYLFDDLNSSKYFLVDSGF